jgi:methionyl-tRNA formyltransferase
MNSNNFKVVFFGTSEFAREILKILFEQNIEVVAVVTRPDKPSGRNLKMTPSPVKEFCLNWHSHIPVLTPNKVSTDEFDNALRDLNPDLFVVAAFGEIIKPHILRIPPYGSINVHPSLLPSYRGPSPLQTALLNGDKKTGVCIIEVVEKMDAGQIYASAEFPIEPDENYTLLESKAISRAKSILIQTIENKRLGKCVGLLQDENLVTFCKKIKSDDEKIDWNQDIELIHNKIRALSDKPCAWTYMQIGDDVKRVKIFSSQIVRKVEFAGNLKKYLYIDFGSSLLFIKSLQVEGKKRLSSSEFLSGLRESYKFL